MEWIIPGFLLFGYHLALVKSHENNPVTLEGIYFLSIGIGYVLWTICLNNIFAPMMQFHRLVFEYWLLCVSVSVVICIKAVWNNKEIIFANKENPKAGVILLSASSIPLLVLAFYLLLLKMQIFTFPLNLF